VYRALMANQNISVPLFLAIPKEVYERMFSAILRQAISDNRVKIIIVDLETETIAE
jgi:3-methyladenine DNA glycosylase/8-oxoguanine DNA glycosylase